MRHVFFCAIVGLIPAFAQVEGRDKPDRPEPRVQAAATATPVAPTISAWEKLRNRPLAADELRKMYSSPPEPSGAGKDWGHWYSFTTPPAPAGFAISEFLYELGAAPKAFRACHSWGECKLRNQNSSTVTIEWRTQGEEND